MPSKQYTHQETFDIERADHTPHGCPVLNPRALLGDAAETLRGLDAERFQCAVTSPPYYWQRDYGLGDGELGHESTPAEYVARLVGIVREVRRVLRRDGVLFLNLGDTYYSAKGRPGGRDGRQAGRDFARQTLRAVDGPGLGVPRKSLLGMPWRVALALQEDGWVLRSAVIWMRPGALPEPSARDRPHGTYEHVFVLAREPRYFFDRAGLGGDEDVWQIRAGAGAVSGAFPEELAERCIACGSRPGDEVLDPFCGGGATLRAAARLGRRSLGIDASAERLSAGGLR